jgi:hypothetical protein
MVWPAINPGTQPASHEGLWGRGSGWADEAAENTKTDEPACNSGSAQCILLITLITLITSLTLSMVRTVTGEERKEREKEIKNW